MPGAQETGCEQEQPGELLTGVMAHRAIADRKQSEDDAWTEA
jgi:hypothetical protein